MIDVETTRPVYSNAGGKTKEEKKANRQKFLEQSRGIYQKGKDSGILAGVENLFLGAGKNQGEMTGDKFAGDKLPVDDKPAKEPMKPALKWGLIIGGVAVVGLAVYYFGFRKKSA